MSHVVVRSALVLVGLAACSKDRASIAPATLDQIEKTVGLIAEVPERGPSFLLQVVAESALLGPACSKLLQESESVNPAERAAVMSRMHGVCEMTCPSATVFASLAEMKPADRNAAIDKDCNRGGPDPIFGTDQEARRRSDPGAYVLTRFVFEASMAKLRSDGSARATEVAAKIGALAPTLARALANPTPDGGSALSPIGDAPAPDAPPADAPPLDASIAPDASLPQGSITLTDSRWQGASSQAADAVVAKVEAAYMGGLKRCYGKHLAVDPTAKGSLVIQFGVAESGLTVERQVSSFHADHARCVEQLVPAWRFAQSAEGERVPMFALTFEHAPP